ncbi:MAG: type II secretion system F family protein [Actinomycetota bacterium]
MIHAALAGGLAGLATVIVARAAAIERRTRLLTRLGSEPEVRRSRPRVPAPVLLVVGAGVAWMLGGRAAGVAGSVAATAAVVAAPTWTTRRRRRRREHEMQERLADAVSLIASAMRSGRSLQQAVEPAAAELDPPLDTTFRRLADRAELGHSMDEAIEAWAIDVGGPDARLVAGVLKLHRRTGGSLAATLDDLAGTLRDRRGAARELESLTAQARLSATILGLLPIGFFLFLSVVARPDLEAAYETPTGAVAIALGFGLQAAAYVWIRRLLRVEP